MKIWLAGESQYPDEIQNVYGVVFSTKDFAVEGAEAQIPPSMLRGTWRPIRGYRHLETWRLQTGDLDIKDRWFYVFCVELDATVKKETA